MTTGYLRNEKLLIASVIIIIIIAPAGIIQQEACIYLLNPGEFFK